MIIKNIESKIRLATFLAAGSLIALIVAVTVVSYFAYRQVGDARKTIYVLDEHSQPLLARQSELAMNRPVEYRAAIAHFHSLFFTLAPDDKFIEYQMKQAMYLVDESGVQQYNNLKEKGFFNSILSSSAILTIETDSVYLDEARKYFRFYGKQKIDRKSSSVTRSLITEGYLQDLKLRTDNNPHAVLITRWKTLVNKDLENEQKSTF